jgi:glycosyltransferase involved in cell wall biosynthesis
MEYNLYIEPKVSVIMPTYNGSKFLQEAIFSVLQQDYKNIEVLICDDASNDNTRDIIEEIKEYHDHDNQLHIITQSHNQ